MEDINNTPDPDDVDDETVTPPIQDLEPDEAPDVPVTSFDEIPDLPDELPEVTDDEYEDRS